MKTCKVPSCNRTDIGGHGWCCAHYSRWWRHGDVQEHIPLRGTPMECSVKGCSCMAKARGWCVYHYDVWHKYGDPLYKTAPYESTDGICKVKGCSEKILNRRLCMSHYNIYSKNGIDPSKPFTCYICGKEWTTWPIGKHIAMDHIHPKSRGGIETAPVCFGCNHKKHNLTLDELKDWCQRVITYTPK